MFKNNLGYARAHSLGPTPVIKLIITCILTLGIGAYGHYMDVSHKAEALPAAFTAAVAPVSHSLQAAVSSAPVQALANAVRQKPELVARETELDDGQTFAEMLSDEDVPDVDAAAVANALGKVFDLRQLRAGQSVNLFFNQTGQTQTLTSVSFAPEATKELSVSRNDQGGFTASQKVIPVIRQRMAAAGEIRSSLYEAGDRAGVPHAVMAALMHVYAHDVDFQRDIHSGDRFEILYDQPMTTQGKAVGEGSIIYASLHIGNAVRPVYRVTFNDGTSDYFDASGHSVRRALLRTPVAAARITSGYGMRMHPLLGYSKMHKGVDFGAPTGTPIFAAGNGTIEDIGFKNGYGRYIRIRHNGQLATAYAHMSRFNTSLHHGSHVIQGQVIGYVGMSGRATGPHLHFEVQLAGHQVNPMTVNLPTGRVLEGNLLALFKQGKNKIDEEYTKAVSSRPTSDGSTGGVIKASALKTAYTHNDTACSFKGGC